MPESIRYRVSQKRTVTVTANNAEDAAQIAAAAFKHGQNSDNGIAHGQGPRGVWGNTTSRIQEKSIIVERLS